MISNRIEAAGAIAAPIQLESVIPGSTILPMVAWVDRYGSFVDDMTTAPEAVAVHCAVRSR